MGKSLHHSCKVETYSTRNFATFEPLYLQLPFTIISILSLNKKLYFYSTGQVSDLIHHFNNFAKSCVFVKQSPSPNLLHLIKIFKNKIKHSFSRSYRVILPSSFNIILPNVLVFYTSLPVSVLVRFLKLMFFLETI